MVANQYKNLSFGHLAALYLVDIFCSDLSCDINWRHLLF